MADERELTREELEQQEGESLPAREVMSMISTNPGLIAIPEDPTTIEAPADDNSILPAPKPTH
jgi:hypothetical protein